MNAIIIKEKEITYLSIFNDADNKRRAKVFLTKYYKAPHKMFSMFGFIQILKEEYGARVFELAMQDNVLLTNTLLAFFQNKEDKRAAEMHILQNKLTKEEIVDAVWNKYNADAIYEVNEF